MWLVRYRHEIDAVNLFVGTDYSYNYLCYFDR